MGRRGPQRDSAERLRRVGSWRAKERERLQRCELVTMDGPFLTDYLAAAILDRARQGMKQADIAREAGISEGCLSQFLAGTANASGDTVDRIARALKLRLCCAEEESEPDEVM